jgi:copper resistance protein C
VERCTPDGHRSRAASLTDVATSGTLVDVPAQVASAPTRRTTRWARVGAQVTVLAVLGFLPLGAGPAGAHASLLRASPADGSTVVAAPARVSLTFDETVLSPAVIVVTGPGGQRVSTGTVEVLDNTASTAVTIEATGGYTVAFRVVSADGHPIAERTTFRLAGANTSSPASSPEPTAAAVNGVDEATPQRRTWLLGSVAGAALLGGLGLLTVARRRALPSTRNAP